MKKILLLTIIPVLFAFSAYADELKIAYVDLNRALNESAAGEKAVKVLEDMVKAKQETINEKGLEIKKIEDELAKQASILTEESINEKRDQREKLLRDYKRMVKDSQDEVQKKQKEFMADIITNLRTIVAKIGEEEGYSMILERTESGILYIPEDLDITDKLITKFNEKSKGTEK